MRKNIRSIIITLILVGIVAVIVFSSVAGMNQPAEINNDTELLQFFLPLEDFIIEADEVAVKKLYLDAENNLKITTTKNTEYTYKIQDHNYFMEAYVTKYVNPYNAAHQNDPSAMIECKFEAAATVPWWVSLLPFVLIIGLIIVLYFVFVKSTTGKATSFGKTKTKSVTPDPKKRVLFADVAGADEEKEELQEIVQFLKNPAHYTKLGAKIPHGVLLVGPPGTGKTLLAKAVAGEAGVPFFSISGSDFVEMYVGVGASRVRDLFDKARSSPASIVFIDEIDAVGRQRGAGLGGGHDEREQTLNQLLVEMDGFGGNEGVIVIAATNRPDILDAALLRPGRLDRQITVQRPDIKGREDILKVHAKGKPFERNVNLKQVAKATIGFTGADLANLLNEAALLAARRGKTLIGMSDIDDAMMKIMVGTQKKNKQMSEKERLNTAYHEAGHAIVAFRLPLIDPVRQISIIPSGNALGYTLVVPEEDKLSESKEELLQNIAMTLGGRAAERIIFGDYTGGAYGDIKHATETAHKMVTMLGMSDELGPILFGDSHNEVFLGRDYSSTPRYSGKTAAKIDDEVHAIITGAYKRAEDILNNDIEKLHFVAKYLMEHETMDAEQFTLVMEKDDVTVEDLEAIISEKQRRSEEENAEKRRIEEDRAKREAERLAQMQQQFGPNGYPVGGYAKPTSPTTPSSENTPEVTPVETPEDTNTPE